MMSFEAIIHIDTLNTKYLLLPLLMKLITIKGFQKVFILVDFLKSISYKKLV